MYHNRTSANKSTLFRSTIDRRLFPCRPASEDRSFRPIRFVVHVVKISSDRFPPTQQQPSSFFRGQTNSTQHVLGLVPLHYPQKCQTKATPSCTNQHSLLGAIRAMSKQSAHTGYAHETCMGRGEESPKSECLLHGKTQTETTTVKYRLAEFPIYCSPGVHREAVRDDYDMV